MGKSETAGAVRMKRTHNRIVRDAIAENQAAIRDHRNELDTTRSETMETAIDENEVVVDDTAAVGPEAGQDRSKTKRNLDTVQEVHLFKPDLYPRIGGPLTQETIILGDN